MEENRLCQNPRCKQPILDSRQNVKYCIEACGARHRSSLRYQKIKNDEEYKRKRGEKNKRYYEANKEELRTRMRIYGMEYYHKKQAEKLLEKYKNETTTKEENKEENGGTVGEVSNSEENSNNQ